MHVIYDPLTLHTEKLLDTLKNSIVHMNFTVPFEGMSCYSSSLRIHIIIILHTHTKAPILCSSVSYKKLLIYYDNLINIYSCWWMLYLLYTIMAMPSNRFMH